MSVIPRLAGGGLSWGCHLRPRDAGRSPCRPCPGTEVFALLSGFQRLMAVGWLQHLEHSGLTRHACLLSTPILDSRARSGMPHTIKKCPARRDLEAGT